MASPFASIGGGSDQPTQTAGNPGDTAFDGYVVPSSLAEIVVPILCAANEVEKLNPRTSMFYTFEEAHCLDPTSSGRGVRQFKTAILQRLEKKNENMVSFFKSIFIMILNELRWRGIERGNDALEMQSFYQHYEDKYIQALQNSDNEVERAQLTKAYETAEVLSEVLKSVNSTQCTKVDGE